MQVDLYNGREMGGRKIQNIYIFTKFTSAIKFSRH